jgi:hypothetical protein
MMNATGSQPSVADNQDGHELLLAEIKDLKKQVRAIKMLLQKSLAFKSHQDVPKDSDMSQADNDRAKVLEDEDEGEEDRRVKLSLDKIAHARKLPLVLGLEGLLCASDLDVEKATPYHFARERSDSVLMNSELVKFRPGVGELMQVALQNYDTIIYSRKDSVFVEKSEESESKDAFGLSQLNSSPLMEEQRTWWICSVLITKLSILQ